MILVLEKFLSDETWPITPLQELYQQHAHLANSSLISSEFAMFFNNPFASDSTLICRGINYSIHRVILMARSDFFKQLFQTSMQEGVSNIVTIDDEEPEILLLYIKLIYDGHIDDSFRTDVNYLMHMLHCCSKYQSPQLSNLCEFYSFPQITKETVIPFLDVARTYCYPSLEQYCKLFIHILHSYADVVEL